MQITERADPAYWLGRTDAETQRLIRQSAYLAPYTRRFFAQAGIAPGMKVLDIGSGAGDVAFLVAELVGPTGQVVGVDVNAAALDVARARAHSAGLANVVFITGDAREVALDDQFDAVVGRLVLMYLGDPAAALQAFIRHLAPCGIVAFQDYNLRPGAVGWMPELPTWQQFTDWVHAVLRRTEVEWEMGYKLRGTFLSAGLPEPQLHLESRIGGGPEWTGYEEAASVLRSVLPLILKFGIATASEVDIDTFEDRLRAETVAADGVVKMPDIVSAWARIV
jgi:SAM-dependent methyltransferase